jgi:hypothetical protein
MQASLLSVAYEKHVKSNVLIGTFLSSPVIALMKQLKLCQTI